MHRLASIPGELPLGELALTEQPVAPILFLTSAATDISTIAKALEQEPNINIRNKIRALPLS